MNGITTSPLPRSVYSDDYTQQEASVAAKSEAVKLSSDQLDAARKIVESKVITQFDKSQNNGDTLKPSLRAPSQKISTTQTDTAEGVKEEKKSSLETYNALMAKMVAMFGEQSIDELQARVDMYTKYSKENGTASSEVLEQIETEDQAYTSAKAAEAAAMQDVTAAESNVIALEQEIASLQQSQADIEDMLKDPTLSSDQINELSAQLKSIASQLAQKQSALSMQQTTLAVARQNLSLATDELNQIATQLQSSLKYLDSLNKNAATVNSRLEESLKTTQGTSAYLMAQLITIIGESTEETMELNLKFSQKVQRAQQEKLENDAEEVEKQQEKSRHMQETMGCVGKIIGAIVTIVSTVAAIFTGGASLALAAIGIALMVSDKIYQKVTGNESFIAAALKPLVEHVLMPIIQLIANVISDVLEALGVKNDIAEIVATVLAVAILIIAAIGAAVVAKQVPVARLMNIVGDMLKNVLNTVIKTVVQIIKPLISGMKNIADEIGAAISKMMKSLANALNQLVGSESKSKLNLLKEFFSDEANIKTLGNKFNLAEDILRVTNASIDSAGNIAAGTLEKRVSEMLAEITEMLSASATMKLFTDSVTESYSRSIENLNMLMTNAADMAGEEQQVGQFIFAHTRA
ncbi:type III secretion system translocon subunit SctE [Lelliottia sp. WAP21]|uniref:type III secretion system translocon subunit SctE n=1 Tax=Lelliottia sp. WAP21 TaxID=2877426 RepID=UPI001E5210C9|nr:type III secretion system translocon subunit SctE [Lelliottia sp. WAP21]